MNKKLKWAGRFIRTTRAARFYHDGDGAGMVWNWWHPLAWVLLPIAFIASVAMVGIPETWAYRHEIGIGVGPWFKEHPDRLIWDD